MLSHFNNISIKYKIIGIILLITILVIVIGFSIVIVNDLSTFKNDMENDLIVHATLVGEYSIVPLTFQDKEGAEAILKKLGAVPFITAGCLYTDDGQLFASFSKSPNEFIPSNTSVLPATRSDGLFMYLSKPIEYQERKYGTIYLKASKELLESKMTNYLFSMFFIVLGLLILSYWAAVKLQGVISRPLLELSEFTKRISEKADYSMRLENNRNDEIGNLCKGFNSMLGHIASRQHEMLEAKTRLQESEELYKKLIATLPDIIIRTDLNGNIVFINETKFSALGYTNNDKILGKNIIAFLSSKDHVRAFENMKKMLENYLGPHEYTLHGEEGRTLDCEVNGDVLRDNHDVPYGYVFVIRDLTEKKKLQAQLLQAQKMEAIGRLAGGVAHDYNNMLGVILGYADLLEKEIPPEDPANKMVQSIIVAAERSAHLTKQLLAFARRQIIAPIITNLNEEINTLQKMLGRLIPEDIKLVIKKQENLWNIKIDPTQLTQILTNLATNARDAISSFGTITIETTNVVVDRSKTSEEHDVAPGEYVMLSFGDTGCGMTSETVAQIFEPFFTTKSIEKGTGLGLPTVFGIVKQNNGFIHVSSVPEEGTTFKLYFPRFAGEVELQAKQKDESLLTGSETILVVEDEEELLEMMKSVLRNNGYTVVSTTIPTEALKVCKSYGKKIDLLVTDVVMPGMNGRELQEHIQAAYTHIRTLFISGYSADIVANRGVLEEGMFFLQKPFVPSALLKKVKEVLQG